MTTQHDERAELIRELVRLADIHRDCGRLVSKDGTAERVMRKAAALLAADGQAGGEVDRRLKVKLGSQYGRCLVGHWFYLQPADELADAALARHTGTETHPHPQAVAQGWNGCCPGECRECEATDICLQASQCMRNDGPLPAAPAAPAAAAQVAQPLPPGHTICMTCDGKGITPLVDDPATYFPEDKP